MLSLFFPVFDKLSFDDLVRDISFGDHVYYFENFLVSGYLRDFANLLRDRICLRILSRDFFLRRIFLFSLLRFMVNEASLKFLYFTRVPIRGVGEFDLDPFDYVVIKSLDDVNPSVYGGFLRGVYLSDKSVVLTCSDLDRCSPDFLGVSCLRGFRDIRLDGFSYEDYKSIIQKKFNLTKISADSSHGWKPWAFSADIFVIKKLINTLEKDARVRRILEELFDREEISEIIEELYNLYNDLANS